MRDWRFFSIFAAKFNINLFKYIISMKPVTYIGCDDAELDLFESQYELPEGMCYNSYLLAGEKIAIMDSVDPRKTDEWLEKLAAALEGRKPDYLIVQHMEPDHSGSIRAFREAYPQTEILASEKALLFMQQFNEGLSMEGTRAIHDGDELDLGGLTLRFIAAPFVHWPEVMMTYVKEVKTLFSADGFGKFGVYDADPDDWACEARRYYFNICGKYGVQVQKALDKVKELEVDTICPLHGPVLEGEKREEAMRLYTIWSAYDVETNGVLVAHASIHGNTAAAANLLAEMLRARGFEKVAVADLCRDDMAEVIEDAFRMGRMVCCCATYDGDIFPPMHTFLWKLQLKGYRDRKVGLLENGTWAPVAARKMREIISTMKDVEIVEPVVSIKSSLHDADIDQLEALANAISK